MAKGKYEEWLTEEGLLLIEGWARDGLTDEQISKNMGVAYSTLREWVKKYSALSAALKKSKEVVDREVESALYKKAIGHTMTEQQAIKLKTVHYDNGKRVLEEERVEIVEVERAIPPDTTAQIFWLKNRKPNDWRDKHEQNINFNPADMTDEQIEQMVKAYVAQTE
jgi:transposase-like protein